MESFHYIIAVYGSLHYQNVDQLKRSSGGEMIQTKRKIGNLYSDTTKKSTEYNTVYKMANDILFTHNLYKPSKIRQNDNG